MLRIRRHRLRATCAEAAPPFDPSDIFDEVDDGTVAEMEALLHGGEATAAPPDLVEAVLRGARPTA